MRHFYSTWPFSHVENKIQVWPGDGLLKYEIFVQGKNTPRKTGAVEPTLAYDMDMKDDGDSNSSHLVSSTKNISRKIGAVEPTLAYDIDMKDDRNSNSSHPVSSTKSSLAKKR